MGGCLQWSVENDETGCLQWSEENDETWVGVYSGVWRMMRHGWVFTVECGE